MYRDLKPENVLIFDNGYVKLTDFGLAKQTTDEDISKTEAGTVFYYAPEMILKAGYNKPIDFWTLGIYLYEMSVHEPPFSTEQIKNSKQKIKKIVQDAEINRDWKKSNLSPELQNLINGLLKFEPQERLGVKSWDEIKTHKFFDGFDWAALLELRMESPLKSLVQKYPIKIKPYNPEIQNDQKNLPQSTGKVEGWTFVKEDKDKIK